MSDPHRIENEDQLRETLGHASPGIENKVSDALDPVAVEFIERSPLVFVSTCDAEGRMDVSPKGDTAGFVGIENPSTLLVPDRPGNRLIFGHLNVLANPKIGLIFVIPNVRETLRINGRAELTRDPEVLASLPARGKPALLATRVFVEESFLHCGKAMIRSEVWKPETWGEKLHAPIARQFAANTNAGDEAVDAIEAALEQDYRENI